MGWLFTCLIVQQPSAERPQTSTVPLCYRRAWQQKAAVCNFFLPFRARAQRVEPLEQPVWRPTIVSLKIGAQFGTRAVESSLAPFGCRLRGLPTRPKNFAGMAVHLRFLHGCRLGPPKIQNPKSKRPVWILDFGSWVLDFGFLDFGFWILVFGFWILEFGFRILHFGSWILEFGFWILDLGFCILDFGFRILDFAFWILNFGFWIVVVSVVFVAARNAAVWILDLGFGILDFGSWILDFGFLCTVCILQKIIATTRRLGSAD